MSGYVLKSIKADGKPKRLPSQDIVIDFSGVRIGSGNLLIQESSGKIDVGAVAIKSSAVPADDSDLVNKLALNSAIAALQSGTEWQDSCISVELDSANIVSPAEGDRYLINGTGAGAFIGHDNKIAEWNGSAWVFTSPSTGMAILVDDEPTKMYIFGTTSWGSKSFESTTASGFLSKVGDDIQLTNLDSAKFIVGNGSNAATAVAMSGDATMDNAGAVTIGNGAITTVKIFDSAVEESKIGAAAVTASKIGADAVNATHINPDVAGARVRQNSSDGSLEQDVSDDYQNDNAGVVSKNQIVFVQTDGHVDLALATNADSYKYALGIVEDATIAAAATGKVIDVIGIKVGGFTGLTPGEDYYVSRSTPGALVDRATAFGGHFQVTDHVYFVGKAYSATELTFAPNYEYEY